MVFALGPDLRGLSTAVPPTGDPSPSHPAPAQASTRLGLWDPQGRGSAMLTVSSGQLPGQSLALKGPQRWLCWGCVWQAWGTHPKTGTPRVSWGRGRPGLTRTELSVDRGREHTWRGTPAPQHRKSPSQRLPDPHGWMLRHPGGGWGPPCPPGSLRAVSFFEGWGQVPWWQGVRGAVWAEG